MKHINKYQKYAIVYLIGLVGLWLAVHLHGSKTSNLNYLFSFMFGLTPLLAGLVGLQRSKMWGRFGSVLGKAVFYISLGLVCWGTGETIWSYYNFFRHVPAPYPSLADLGFAPSVFFWVVGASYLALATGAWRALKRSKQAKLVTLFTVVSLSLLSYYLLIHVARRGVLVPEGETTLKVLLDVAYPLGDFLAAIFAFVVFTLSFKYFGGLYRMAIGAILAGLGTMYVGDFVFSYTTTTGSYYNGDWGDLLLCVGLFLLSYGVLGFSTKPVLAAEPQGEGRS